MENKYEEIMESADNLRNRFFDVILKSPTSFIKIATEIGISELTLAKFIKTKRPLEFFTICKIKKYVEEQEKTD